MIDHNSSDHASFRSPSCEREQSSLANTTTTTPHKFHKATSRAELAALTLLDVIHLDERPTFAIHVDTSDAAAHYATPEIVYFNPALAAADELLARVSGQTSPNAILSDTSHAYAGFNSWLVGLADEHDGARREKTYLFENHIWAAITVGHLKVVSGVQSSWSRTGSVHTRSRSRTSSSRGPRERKRPKYRLQMNRTPKAPTNTPPIKHAPYDYTLDLPPANISNHLLYFRSIDWAQTSLGPMGAWPPQLRCIVNIILNNSYPSVLFWGQNEVAMVYNEAYLEVIGSLHPCMGASGRMVMKQYWAHLQPLVDHINATGQTLSEQDMPLFLDRHGFLEETFFSFQIIPILDSAGHVAGYYQPLTETTKTNLLERRVSSLVEIGSQTAKARDLPTYWDLVLNTLRISDKDAPFALLYAAEYEAIPDISPVPLQGGTNHLEYCRLKGAIGAEADHPIAPSTINMREGSNVFLPHLLQSAKSRKPTLVHFDDLGISETALSGINWKGYGDACRCVVICPILPTTSEQVQGFLILGVSPRRPFDDDYQQFVQVLIRLLATSLASVVLFDEDIRQRENSIGQAARIQEQLFSELKAKENIFQRFAERAAIGIFIIDPHTRKYLYRNQSWFSIFQVSTENCDDATNSWARIVPREDLAACEAWFAEIFVEKKPVFCEVRTKIPWHPPIESQEPSGRAQEHFTWILCSAYAELSSSGEIVEIVGNVTDISKQKWAEGVQKMRTENALESKKHLELFIDSTSHEMRNPLSAIMQCADGILSSYCLPGERSMLPSLISNSGLLEQTLDAAQTIGQCAQHMKRIVDDILTISKLESGLFAITPIDAQPESVANHAVKMFEAEAKTAGVTITFVVEQSYRDLAVDWVSLDPTRLLQVLINLVTNAIKFTRLEATRLITISVGASVAKPVSTPGGVQFINTKLVDDDCRLKDDWKHGSTLHIQFSVRDTGRGLSEDEMCKLFARFSQASPKTHIHYGGSGLGLFISRRLTEMQGGAIGLYSEEKRGSIFSFYIKARQTTGRDRQPGSMIPDDPGPKDTNKWTDSIGSLALRSGLRMNPKDHEDDGAEAHGRTSGMVLPTQTRKPEEGNGTGERKSGLEDLHVLIVEDNLVNQRVLAKQLRILGAVVYVANHGGECLEFLKGCSAWNHGDDDIGDGYEENEEKEKEEEMGGSMATGVNGDTKSNIRPIVSDQLPIPLSLILMDWEMPTMNGLTCISRIRHLQRTHRLSHHIPVIGITANVRAQQVQNALDRGMDDVLGKPFLVGELVERIAGVLEQERV